MFINEHTPTDRRHLVALEEKVNHGILEGNAEFAVLLFLLHVLETVILHQFNDFILFEAKNFLAIQSGRLVFRFEASHHRFGNALKIDIRLNTSVFIIDGAVARFLHVVQLLIEVGHVQQLDCLVKRHSERYFAVAFQRLNGKVFHHKYVDLAAKIGILLERQEKNTKFSSFKPNRFGRTDAIDD